MSYSSSLCEDANRSVLRSISKIGIVNIPVTAAEILGRHQCEALSQHDAERLVLGLAELHSAAIEFNRTPSDEATYAGGLLIEIVQGDFDESSEGEL